MAFAPRLLAPVAAPPPPKPPQLNIVASALMPDVATDTFGPGEGPLLASGGFESSIDPDTGRRMWHRMPNDEPVRAWLEKRNAMVAAIEQMSDVELKQAEVDVGVTEDSLPESIFMATADSRWTGGFAYAPENQYRGVLNDTCGQVSDLPFVHGNGAAAPTGLVATPSNTGGNLSNAASPYSYVIAAVFPDGSTSTPSAAVPATIAAGSSGSVALSGWTNPAGAVGTAIFGRFANSYKLLATVTGATFTDTGASAPTLSGSVPLGNLPLVGYVPFLIQVVDQASAIGWQKRDYVGRALRLLDSATPNAIERELWNGAFAQGASGGPVFQADMPYGMNGFFTQSGTPSNGGTILAAQDLTPSTVPSITRGLQILEDYLANSGFGGQGMLHVTPETSPNLLGARRVGSLLLSVMDNIIVPGSGYPTSGNQGPAGSGGNINPTAAGQAWMFATDLVSVRLDAPNVYPSTLAEALDRGPDELGGGGAEPDLIRFRGQRYAAATWDQARLAAVRVNLAT